MYPHRMKNHVALACAIVVLGAGVGACSRATATHDADATVAAPMGVILGPEDLERWVAEGLAEYTRTRQDCVLCALEFMKIPSDIEFWRPSPAQVLPFERRVYDDLRRAWREENGDVPLERYSVSYIGFVQDGKRLIYARGECGHRNHRQSGWTPVFDGGVCYFSATYDLETGKFGIGYHEAA